MATPSVSRITEAVNELSSNLDELDPHSRVAVSVGITIIRSQLAQIDQEISVSPSRIALTMEAQRAHEDHQRQMEQVTNESIRTNAENLRAMLNAEQASGE